MLQVFSSKHEQKMICRKCGKAYISTDFSPCPYCVEEKKKKEAKKAAAKAAKEEEKTAKKKSKYEKAEKEEQKPAEDMPEERTDE